MVDQAIGPTAVGAYLHGSAVHGGLQPASDLDILVVCQRSMDDRERQALVEGPFQISGPQVGPRSIELTVVVQSEVRPWRFPPTGDFLYGDWLREAIKVHGPPRPEPMPNLAIMIPLTLAGNHPLNGRAPGSGPAR